MTPKMQPEVKQRLLRIFTNRASAPTNALVTIDVMKGISLIAMLFMHFAHWRSAEWQALMQFVWYITDFFGPMMFVTISAVASMVSYYSQIVGKKVTPYSRRKLLRVSFLFIYGEIFNLFAYWYMGIYHVVAWNAITLIALFSLLIPLMLRIQKGVRVVIIAILAAAYFPLVQWSMGAINSLGIDINAITLGDLQDPRTIVYWIFFNHAFMTPIFSWLIIPLLTSVIFEDFVIAWNANNREKVRSELKKIGYAGAILIIIGVATGFWLAPDYNLRVFNHLKAGDLYFIWPFPQGLFVFLIRDTPQYMFYNLGIIFVLFSIIGSWQLVRRRTLFLEAKIVNLGRYSLSVYTLSFLGFIIPLQLSLLMFLAIACPLLVLIILIFWFLNKKFKGIGTLEWLSDIYTNLISFAIDMHREKRKSLKNII